MMEMMKLNARLCRTDPASHISAFGGAFVFFASIDISVLFRTGMLSDKLQAFIFKAIDVQKALRNKGCEPRSSNVPLMRSKRYT